MPEHKLTNPFSIKTNKNQIQIRSHPIVLVMNAFWRVSVAALCVRRFCSGYIYATKCCQTCQPAAQNRQPGSERVHTRMWHAQARTRTLTHIHLQTHVEMFIFVSHMRAINSAQDGYSDDDDDGDGNLGRPPSPSHSATPFQLLACKR